MVGAELTFPLVPRRRLTGLAYGAMHSARRGMGSDVAGSRPYLPGDDVDTIDWHASARLSSARANDEFIVQEHYAEEAPRVVVFCDRRPEMALFPPPLPWLAKPAAMRQTVELILASTAGAQGFVGYLDYASGEPFWQPPQSEHKLWESKERYLAWPDFAAPPDTLALGLGYLAQHRRSLPAGSFLFVLSDFLETPPADAWLAAVERYLDIVPVVIQDPVWEQSFPDVACIVVPLVDPVTGRLAPVRLSRKEAEAKREANEGRFRRLLDGFRGLDLEPIVVSSSDPTEILSSFIVWADERRYRRGRPW